MHELSIATAVVHTACRHAGDRPVSTASVRTGRLRACGAADVAVLSGQELEVDYIEIEELEATCTGRK